LIGKIAGWLIVIMIAVWVVTNPVGAGHAIHQWVSSIFAFFSALTSK
jgi:hypothetical protein